MCGKPLTSLKGVGPKLGEAFSALGVNTVEDLIRFLPRTHLNYSKLSKVAALSHGDLAAVSVKITKKPVFVRVNGLNMVSCTVEDDSGTAQLIWFNQPYRAKQITVGETVVACGRADTSRGLKLVSPDIYDELPGILPVYRLPRGLSQKRVRTVMAAALDAGCELEELYSPEFMRRFGICGIMEATKSIHFPADMDALTRASQRFAFTDALLYLILLSGFKRQREGSRGVKFDVDGLKFKFESLLPFKLTNAQSRVIDELTEDMRLSVPMNRLLQGDVGSGKTVVALYAMYVAISNGYQAALMAPTEILAQQHFAALKKMFGESAVILKGKMTAAERREALARISGGEAKAIVGTHALLNETLAIPRLGAVIADEQHRFGVRQRAVIAGKGATARPDMLIMSATPIPRTLSLMLYGDLDISVLDELPPGREPIQTSLVPKRKRAAMYGFIHDEILKGGRAYVVCPLVEDSDELDVRSATQVYGELCEKLPDIGIGLLHGRMSPAAKDAMICGFKNGELQMLVSTTVVEVGVDVPEATIMAVENAERFGLAQLHQLRGRVGRGREHSYCFLLADEHAKSAAERLNALVKTQDGFEIARMDLDLRGPGEYLGQRQHGESMGFDSIDPKALALAREAVDELENNAEYKLLYSKLINESSLYFGHSSRDISLN